MAGDPGLPLSVQVYETLRRRIMLGELAQGSRLHEPALAAELEVSRVPLREALPRLHHEGLISAAPRRSSVVTTWTEQLVNDLFDARLALEVAAAGQAARHVRRGSEPLNLEEAVRRAEDRLAAESESLAQAAANSRIHMTLIEASGNELMTELMTTLSSRMTWLFYLTSDRDLHVQHDEHAEILRAILSGNDKMAEALTYSHIESGREPSLKAVASR